MTLWPDRASVYAGHIDALMWIFTGVVALLAGPVFLLIAYFAWKYRRGRPADRDHVINQSIVIETSWAAIPFLVTIGFFAYAAWMTFGLHRPPRDALTINVVAKQWMWKFQHPEGQREIDDLHVPAGQPVRLVMTSQDAIHSLYLPELRIKQDVLPGRYTQLWFTADRPGVYRILCSQFCGFDHSGMIGRFVVETPGDYSRWLATSQADQTMAGEGRALYRALGCSACHEPGGPMKAPSLTGLAGKTVPLADGATTVAGAQYLHDSIVDPNRLVVAGYPAQMPTYAGQVDDGEIAALIAFIQSLAPDRTGLAS
ncbi:MAG TPA: cytochrome c oxidase subunit II [Caulobacteraceae bacterium]|nr:cytochrome c oxidase subunit II [Caulobacteraceae bacterium]